MIKKGLLAILLIGFVMLSLFVSSQELTITNASLKKNYSSGETFSGNFSLKAIDISPNYYLKSSLGHSISLREFLKNNFRQLDCEASGCSEGYTSVPPAFENITFDLNPQNKKILGLKIEGENIDIREIQITAKLNFEEQLTPPLSIILGKSIKLDFLEQSENFTRSFVQGVSYLAPQDYDKTIGISPYCQELTLLKTKKILAGANFSSIGQTHPKIIIEVLKEGAVLGTCDFNPNNTNSCIINLEKEIISGSYFICVNSAEENSNLALGFKTSSSPKGYYLNQNTGGNYAIFAAIPTYSAMEDIEIDLFVDEEMDVIVSELNKYLKNNYGSPSSTRVICKPNCLIPLIFTGVNQETSIESVRLIYSHLAGTKTENYLYNLVTSPPKANFEGYLNLEKANFVVNFSGTKKVSFFLEEGNSAKKIIEESITSAFIPLVIRNLYPQIVPAGIPSLFVIDILSATNINQYNWVFGDGTTQTTTENNVRKAYNEIKTYTLSVSVNSNGSDTFKKSFQIEAISPRDYLNRTIEKKNAEIENIKEEINLLNIPLKENLKNHLNLDKIQTLLNSIDSERRTATTNTEFLDLAIRLQDLEIPETIWIEGRKNEPFILDSGKIDLLVISDLANKQISDNKYKEYISNWQIANVQGNIETIKIAIINSGGLKQTLATVYKINVVSQEDAYLIMQNTPDLASTTSLENLGQNSKKINLVASQEKKLDLISFQNSDMVSYVSLDPSRMEITGELSPCNNNKVCEKSLGENSDNCRSDCKPWGRAIFLLIFIIFLIGGAYLFIQIQFKKKYELHLFRSEQELKNLVESIQNSIENNISEKEITEKLIKNGWSKEQIIYSIKKSKGERTRPYELVSMDKLLDKLNLNKEIKTKKDELPKKAKG